MFYVLLFEDFIVLFKDNVLPDNGFKKKADLVIAC